MVNKNWIVIDNMEGSSETFETKNEALNHAKEIIEQYLDSDGWPPELLDGSLVIAKITHESTMTNKRDVEKDEDGNPINSEWDFMCDCEMAEVKDEN